MEMREPQVVKIVQAGIKELDFDKVIYGERSQPGAMGNVGGVIFYALDGETFTHSHANLHSDEAAYREGQNRVADNESKFVFYRGGFGNSVFVKKGIELEIDNEGQFFVYRKDDVSYKITSSVIGVFNNVSKEMILKNIYDSANE